MRQIGELGIKLMGVYFAASAIVGIAGMLAFFISPQLEGFPSAWELASANVPVVLGHLVVASVCLFRGHSIARQFFADERLANAGLSRRDLLVGGISLLGLGIALGGVPGIVQIAAAAVWYAEGSRQPMFMAAMERWWEPLVNSGLALLVGIGTAMGAGRIASVLEARYAGASDGGGPVR